MKKTNKKKKKDNVIKNDVKKILVTLGIVILIVVIIGGSTFSYWRWESISGNGANSQQTNISGTVPGHGVGGFELNITDGGVSMTQKTMYPTNDCDGSAALVSDITTVTAVNPSSTDMTVFLAIRASLTAAQGTLNSTNKGKLKWAIIDTNTSATCANPTASGTLSTVGTSATDIDTTIRFTATKETTTKKYYKMFIWLDSTYTHTNYGDTVSDPMQNLTINVGWSPDSVMAQSPSYSFNP